MSRSNISVHPIVALGDRRCGRTSLLHKFANTSRSSSSSLPRAPFSSHFYRGSVRLHRKNHDVVVWDPPTQDDDFLANKPASVILLCFSFTSPSFLENLRGKWVPLVRRVFPGVPYILVSCQQDLKADELEVSKFLLRGEKPLSMEDAGDLVRLLGASAMVECSAGANRSVTEVLTTALEYALKPIRVSQIRVLPRKKLVVVGDGGCGKTCLLQVFGGKPFDHRYVPTVFQNFCMDFDAGGMRHDLTLWDTAGQEEYDRLRPLSYDLVHCIILCFACDDHESFERIATKWVPEVHALCPGVPYILVACKRENQNNQQLAHQLQAVGQTMVTREEGEQLAKSIGASAFVECSSLTGQNVYEVFEAAIEYSLEPRQPRTCSIM